MKKPPLATLSKQEYELRLHKMLLAALGKCWMYWPPRAEVKRRCKDPNRPGWSICEQCHESREVLKVDHINPCVDPVKGNTSWGEYIERRFVFGTDGLQGLCTDCHGAKSKEENKIRQGIKKHG